MEAVFQSQLIELEPIVNNSYTVGQFNLEMMLPN